MSKHRPIRTAVALKRMRELSKNNIPFSFGFVSCNTTNQSSEGYKLVAKGLLRAGLRADQSGKANTLISYMDYSDTTEDKNRQFNYALLMMFNGQTVTP
jgi:predicted class III extradiol MEMO1 family dioxygenase